VAEADVVEMAPVVLTHRLIVEKRDPHEVVRLAVASAA
jgi:hypothetical protein